ncbi:MAG: 2-amino-4-hydroxy-6-hydroxymethyldihydropteridine diphosphokinase [Bacteroidetes bacterium]|nr:2-amino-4-hydroxy-6-hydroxymethyldihydropteridine diphosphokinase [Bacteroidota bacterium]
MIGSDPDFFLARQPEELILCLGTNLGDKEENLIKALENLESEFGPAIKKSTVHETEPWGKKDQDAFLNQVLIFETNVRPHIAMEEILRIERDLGRIRYEKWGPRLIDIDILFYGNQIFKSDFLEIPHPYLHLREFVLKPLSEVAPDLIHPVLNRTIRELLHDLSAENQVEN